MLKTPMFQVASGSGQLLSKVGFGFKKLQPVEHQKDSDILVQHKKLIVKIASTKMEKLAVFRIRKRIFSKEYDLDQNMIPLDFDRYDLKAKHLIVKDLETKKVIGCYRLITSNRPQDLYSSSEFYTDNLKNLEGKIAELSRACIDENFRNGITLNLLWTGLYRFCQRNNIRYLVGIPSLGIDSPKKAEAIFQIFEDQGYVQNDSKIEPLLAFHTKDDYDSQALTKEEARQLVPPLMRVYFKAGAKVHARGAYDPKFRSLDFFTLLDFNELNDKFRNRYQ